jgi:hypothetical protein
MKLDIGSFYWSFCWFLVGVRLLITTASERYYQLLKQKDENNNLIDPCLPKNTRLSMNDVIL